MDVGNVDFMDEVQKEAPLPPSKDGKTRHTLIADASDIELDTSTASHDSAANETESFPVNRAPRTAYIAPALPPIRFSMNSTDFADLLTSVSGLRFRDALTQPGRSDSGKVQASPDQVLVKQRDELITAQSHEQSSNSTHPMVNGSTIERANDIDKYVQPNYETEGTKFLIGDLRLRHLAKRTPPSLFLATSHRDWISKTFSIQLLRPAPATVLRDWYLVVMINKARWYHQPYCI